MKMQVKGVNLKDYASHLLNEIDNEDLKKNLKQLDFSNFYFINLDDLKKDENLGLNFIKSFDFLVLKNNSKKSFFIEVSDILGSIYTKLSDINKEYSSLCKDVIKNKKFQRFIVNTIKKELKSEFREKIKDTLLFYFFIISGEEKDYSKDLAKRDLYFIILYYKNKKFTKLKNRYIREFRILKITPEKIFEYFKNDFINKGLKPDLERKKLIKLILLDLEECTGYLDKDGKLKKSYIKKLLK